MSSVRHLYRRRPDPVAASRSAIGEFGEWLAAEYLVAHGASIVGRNVRNGRGEIDLLVDIDGEHVAVEVKTIVVRSPDDDPLLRFDDVKAARVRATAAGLAPPVFRVDVVGVSITESTVEVRWIPHAG